jgi:ribose-phosphate pyrophosphokinase
MKEHRHQVMNREHQLVLAAGRGSTELAGRIAECLGLSLIGSGTKTFSGGELYCRYDDSIRGSDVFIIQSTASAGDMSPNDTLVELLLMIDAARGASARRVIAVMPWFGYARQDKKSAPREPISARVVARALEATGIDRVMSIDLHAGQIQGFFTVPADHLTAMPLHIEYVRQHFADGQTVIIAPDAGRAKLARKFSEKSGVPYALMEKTRPEQGKAEIGYVIGDVAGKTALILDDMIDSAGTTVAAAETVINYGAREVHVLATHGLFSGPAYQRLAASPLKSVVVSDTVPLKPGAPESVVVLSVANILADSIQAAFHYQSISQLFLGDNQTF